MDKIAGFLRSCGLNEKESDVYVTVRKLGAQPASAIARISGYERVWTYKTLQKLVGMGIMSESIQNGVATFWIPSIDLLHSYIERNKTSRSELEEQFSYIKTDFLSLPNQYNTSIPKIQLFETTDGIRNLFAEMLGLIEEQGLITIKLFATNTFETQLLSNTTIKNYAQNFFSELHKRNITITSYIAEGGIIMEHLLIGDSKSLKLSSLPAGNNAINLFVIGKSIYIIIYKETPVGLKIDSPELSRAMHFLLEQTRR